MSSFFEAVFIEINKSLLNADRNIVVGCIYRPPSSSISEFNDSMKSVLCLLSKEDKHVYLTGDFNINLLDADTHIPSSEFIELLFSYSFLPSINKPTRITSSSATIIDNIFFNNLHSKSITAGILATDVSDHCPVFCLSPFRASAQLNTCVYITRRLYNERNKTKFISMLDELEWSDCEREEDCQAAFSIFYEQYKSCFNRCFPPTRIKQGYKNRIPWLSEELKQSIKRKNSLYRKYLKSKSEIDKEAYRKYKTCLRAALRRAEREHYDHLLSQSKNNLRKSWNIIKEVINKKRNQSAPPLSINVDGRESDDPSIVSRAFNDYFVNVGPSLAQSIPVSNIPPSSLINTPVATSMYIRPVTVQELRNIIHEMKNCAPGPDGIPADIIKLSMDFILPILTHVINLSFQQGVFPSEMKHAKVIPLFKSGDKTKVNNYRPISLLLGFSKIIEKCMASRLIEFLNNHNILYKYQFGFRHKHSTNIALNLLIDKITSSLDQREVFVGVALDFRKAFDTIDFSILSDKLSKYGIRGIAHRWFVNYLNNRFQHVDISNVQSQQSKIQCGVPQGSILGPLLFLLYINDLPLSSNFLPIIFADDTNLFLSGKSPKKCLESINAELVKINNWVISNRLSLNTEKTNFIIFSKRKISDDLPSVYINGHAINRVDTMKFLGVLIDDQLNWNKHIIYIKSKVSKSIGMLNCARRNLNQNTLRKLYFAFVYPYFNYCIDVWGCCGRQQFQSLFILQKRAIRIISGVSRRAHTEPLFISLDILPLESVYILATSLFMYKHYYRFLPAVVDDFFQSNSAIHSVNTRRRNHLHVPITRSKSGTLSIRFRGVHIWNQILLLLNVNSLTLNQFKRKMSCGLLDRSIEIRLNPMT